MSNENDDDATQLGSIGHHMNKPQQPGNPQMRPHSKLQACRRIRRSKAATMKTPCSAHTTQRPPGLQCLRFQQRTP